MTNEKEVLELAKKCGAIVQDVVPYDKRAEYQTITFNQPTFIAFTAALEQKMIAEGWRQCAKGQEETQHCAQAVALEKKHQAQIANLQDQLDVADKELIEFDELRNKNEELQRQLDEAAKQEPVVWMDEYGFFADFEDDDFHIPLYRHPPNLTALIEQARADAVNELHLNCVQVLALASERYDENVCTILGAWDMAMSEIMELQRQLDRAAKQEPVSLDDIYAAWHGAGVDIAGGDLNGFVKMLAAIRARSGK